MYCDCNTTFKCSYHQGYRNIKVGTRIETTYEIIERSQLVNKFFRKLWSVLYDLEKFINQYEKEIKIEVDVFEYQKVI
jgi:coenzyme F420-reducing hydrogenase delta subunit